MPQIGDKIKVFSVDDAVVGKVVGFVFDEETGETVWKVSTNSGTSRRVLSLSAAHVDRHTVIRANALEEDWSA